jgi:hypothetical protein
VHVVSGAIYEITIESRVLRCRLWRDPTVTEEVGARCAAEISKQLLARASGTTRDADRILMDVREGPTAFGPKTEASLRQLFATAASNQIRIAVVVGKAMQVLQFGRLRTEVGLEWLLVTPDEGEATAYVDEVA